jgi:acetylornithine deacetylase/succinyl-diaminopimelate desuccinylase-like protein
MIKSTVTPVLMGGGEELHSVPENAHCLLDVRIIPEQSLDEVVEDVRTQLNRLMADLDGITLDVEVPWRLDGYAIDANASIVKCLQAAHKTVTREELPIGSAWGFSVGSWLSHAGIPTAGWSPGPGQERNIHKVDEFIYVDELVMAANVAAVAAILHQGDVA